METEKKNGRGKKEVSLLGLFGKKFLEETQGKLAEATGISFFIIDYKGQNQYSIDVVPVNIEWNVKTEYDAGGSDWLQAEKIEGDAVNRINIGVSIFNSENTSSDPRTARVVVTTNVEDIGPFEIPVTQEGKPEFLSTLEEDVEFGVLTKGRIIVAPNNETRQNDCTYWDLILWNEGVEYDNVGNFTGTGDKLTFKLYTDVIQQNDDNEYYIPDGTYTVVPGPETEGHDFAAGEIAGGVWGYSHPQFPSGAWYIRMENDVATGDACIKEGTMTVARSGETYDIIFDFISDAGYKVTGKYEGVFDNIHAQ